MLTRKAAIARLRATGTLATEARKGTVITDAQTNTPIARAISKIATSNHAHRDPRQCWLAPGDAQAVLP